MTGTNVDSGAPIQHGARINYKQFSRLGGPIIQQINTFMPVLAPQSFIQIHDLLSSQDGPENLFLMTETLIEFFQM